MNICVFCSSSEGLASEYYEAGFAVGRLIAQGGHTLVFGGYTKGIMGAVAKGCQTNGGKVISVISAVFNGIRPNFEEGAEVVKPVAFLMQGETQCMLARFFSQGVKEGFIRDNVVNKIGFCETPEEILEYISQ